MMSMQEIQGRIESVKVTKQIAQAMHLVSNTKIRRCMELIEGSRPFFKETLSLVASVAQSCGGTGRAFLSKPGPALYVIVGSDRGLCGGYNVGVSRMAHGKIRQESNGAVVFALGTRIHEYFSRRGITVKKSYRGISQSPFYLDGKEVAKEALELFYQGEVSKIVLVYTVFENMLSHAPTAIELLPLEPVALSSSLEMEPENDELLEALMPDYLAGCIFGALAEGALCEQSARVTNMDAAVNNCTDLIEKMQLEFNQARQSAITQELNEIVSGAEAQAN